MIVITRKRLRGTAAGRQLCRKRIADVREARGALARARHEVEAAIAAAPHLVALRLDELTFRARFVGLVEQQMRDALWVGL